MPERLELRNLVAVTARQENGRRFKIPCFGKSSYMGILLATLSSFFFSICSVIVKGLVDINPMELASYRFLGVLLPAIPIVIYNQSPIFPKNKRIILILRCFVGTMGLMLSFYAFRHMSLADASVIIFSTPVFVAIFARLFLNEPCGPFNIITVVLTIIGIALITHPPFIFKYFSDAAEKISSNDIVEHNFLSSVHEPGNVFYSTEKGEKFDIWGPVAALASTLFGANAYVLLRALKGLHFSVIMTNFGGFALVYTLLVSYFIFGQLCLPSCGHDRLLVLALAVFSFMGQILLTLSLQMEQAGPVALARSSDIVFAFIWQIIFFNETPNSYSIIGAGLVIFSVLLTVMRKWLLGLPLDSRIRQKMYFLTIN